MAKVEMIQSSCKRGITVLADDTHVTVFFVVVFLVAARVEVAIRQVATLTTSRVRGVLSDCLHTGGGGVRRVFR